MPPATADNPEGLCDSPFLTAEPGTDAELDAIRSATIGSGLSLACEPGDGLRMQANVQAFSIGKAFKRLVTKVNRAVGGAVDLVRKGLAALARLFKGSDNLVVGVRVKNSDPGFGGPNTFMLRAWGASRGQVVALPGVSVRVFQTITFQGAI
jgi:hypothetical protein